jgi:post-segregation antitoxin (ccd killing protein)
MKRRPGKTVTFSISVDRETERILKQEAARSYGGNVSALVAAIAREAKRQAALDWLLQGVEITPPERAEFLAEVEGGKRARKRRPAA